MVVQHLDKNQELIITYFHNQLFVDYNLKESKKIFYFYLKEFLIKLTSDVIFPFVDVDGDKESSLLFKIRYKYRVNSFNGRGISWTLQARKRHAAPTDYNKKYLK